MKIFGHLVLYMALALGANGAVAGPSDLAALRAGDMKKMNLHAAPKAVADPGFERAEGGAGALADYRGRHVLVNFWAVWCPPCKKEMPMLSELQAEMGGERFEVVTIATGHNPPPAMAKFFSERGIDNLPLHRDPTGGMARAMGVFGLPVSVVLNPEGKEIARLTGEADWSAPEALALLRALTQETGTDP